MPSSDPSGPHGPQLPPSSATSARVTAALVTSTIMIVIGAFIALRPLWAEPVPLTPSRWLDMAFAFFFLLRGMVGLRSAIATRRRLR